MARRPEAQIAWFQHHTQSAVAHLMMAAGHAEEYDEEDQAAIEKIIAAIVVLQNRRARQ